MDLRRRIFVFSGLASAAAQPLPRPNVALIVAGAWTTWFESPSLSKLAASGVSFSRAYTSFPSPGPARTALLTGQFPHMPSPPSEATITALLEKAGYATASAATANDALFALKRFKQNKSFLFYCPSPPESAPPFPNRFDLRDNVPFRHEPAAREAYAAHYAACWEIDREIGPVLAALDPANTIVVFTSLHGEMLGSHGLDGYGQPYEESARVPLIIRYPGRLNPGKSDLLISNVDLMPALLSFCGAPIPEGVQGRDLSSLLLTGKGAQPESIFAEGMIGTPREWRMIVRGFDKLVTTRSGDPTHLFNLAEDPFEMTDLAESRTHRRLKDELGALLTEWRKRTYDGRTASGLKQRK